jgi:hypothetical protein
MMNEIVTRALCKPAYNTQHLKNCCKKRTIAKEKGQRIKCKREPNIEVYFYEVGWNVKVQHQDTSTYRIFSNLIRALFTVSEG